MWLIYSTFTLKALRVCQVNQTIEPRCYFDFERHKGLIHVRMR